MLFGILSLVAQNGEDLNEQDRRLLAWLGMPMTPEPEALRFERFLADLGLVPRVETAQASPVSEAESERRSGDRVAQVVAQRAAAPALPALAASSDHVSVTEVTEAVESAEEPMEPFRDEVPRHWFREHAGPAPVPSNTAVATPASATSAIAAPAPRSRWKDALQIGGTAAGAGAAALIVLAIRRRFGELRRLHQLTAQELAAVKKELKEELGKLRNFIRGKPSAGEDMQAHLDKTDRELDRLFAEIDERHRSD